MALLESEVDPEPIVQLERWLSEARSTMAEPALPEARSGPVAEPAAMVLATIAASGAPDARVVLLRGLDADGLRFYTNHRSAKGQQLAADPRAAAVFYWDRLGRQVRVTGRVERLSQAESAAYFATRPAGSRRAAWASDQSTVAPDRAAIDASFAAMQARFPDDDAIPLPPFWGGYLLRPDTFEFWQQGRDRLHDRLRYRRPAGDEAVNPAGWVVERLQP